MIYTDFGGNHEWMLYPGAIVLVLAVYALASGELGLRGKFWFWVWVLTLLYALGSNIPFLSRLAALPGFDLLRVPSRSLFLAGFSLAVLAAYGLEIFLGSTARKKMPSLLLLALVALTLSLAGGVWFLTGELSLGFVWGAGLILGAYLWLAESLKRRLQPKIWFVFLLGIALLDWGAVNVSVLAFRPKDEVLSEQAEVARYLADQEGVFRTYSPSYSLPQHVAALHRLRLADGVDPLQLASYARFMEPATGVPNPGYSVTMPPYADGDPASDNAAYSPDPSLLGLLNVRYVVSEFDLSVEDLALRDQFGETRVYENKVALPRAWVQPEDAPLGTQIEPVDEFVWEPNRVTVNADGPGLLVLSEMAYPGWIVRVDGENAPLKTVEGILRAVSLDTGEHEVVFLYRPISVFAGLAAFAAGLALVILIHRRSK